MPPRQLKPKRKSVRPANRMLVLLEQMEQQNRATAELVLGLEDRIIARLEPRLQRIEIRLEALEMAVRKNSEDIRKNSEDIAKLQLEVQRLSVILGADREENAIAGLERRVSALEQRMGA